MMDNNFIIRICNLVNRIPPNVIAECYNKGYGDLLVSPDYIPDKQGYKLSYYVLNNNVNNGNYMGKNKNRIPAHSDVLIGIHFPNPIIDYELSFNGKRFLNPYHGKMQQPVKGIYPLYRFQISFLIGEISFKCDRALLIYLDLTEADSMKRYNSYYTIDNQRYIYTGRTMIIDNSREVDKKKDLGRINAKL